MLLQQPFIASIGFTSPGKPSKTCVACFTDHAELTFQRNNSKNRLCQSRSIKPQILKGTLTTFPQCNFSLGFPDILIQNLICHHWLSVWGLRNNAFRILISMPYSFTATVNHHIHNKIIMFTVYMYNKRVGHHRSWELDQDVYSFVLLWGFYKTWFV